MRIAIMSDTHDHIWNLEKALSRTQGISALLHCGDLISPFMVRKLAERLPTTPVHLVWGNNDGDRRLVSQVAQGAGPIRCHGEFADLEIGGLRIWMTHYPEIARAVALSGQYDLVCYGHDHAAHEEQMGATLLLNPGELMGLNGRSGFVLLEIETRSLTWVDIG